MKARIAILISVVAALCGCNEPQSSDFVNNDSTNHTIEVTEKVSVGGEQVTLLRDRKTGNEYMLYSKGGMMRLEGRGK